MNAREEKHGYRKLRAFTLIELTVVISLIALLALTAIPTVLAMLRGGADAQAYNMMTAMLAGARSEALLNNTYTAVHSQMGVKPTGDALVGNTHTFTFPGVSSPPSLDNRLPDGITYIGLFRRSTVDGTWGATPGYSAKPIPGFLTFGQVDATFVSTNTFNVGNMNDFTSFTIIFAPNGSIVRQVNGNNITAALHSTPAFVPPANQEVTQNTSPAALWQPGADPDEPGTTAMTLFDFFEWSKANKTGGGNSFLNTNGQLIPINTYTGQLYQRK